MRILSEKDESLVVLRFLWARVSRHKKWIVASVIFAAGGALVQIETAALVKKFLDEALVPKQWDKVIQFSLFLVGLFLFDGLCDFFHRLCLRVAVERCVRRLRNEVFERFLVFSPAQIDKVSSGKAVNHVVNDVFVVGLGLHVIADLIKEPLTFVALTGYLFYLNWQLSLVCLLAVPVIGIIGKGLGKSARRNQARIQSTLDHVTNHIVETVGGLRTIHAFGFEARLREEFEVKTADSYRFLIRMARIEELISPLTKWFTSWIGAVLVCFGGWLVVHNKLTPGALVGFVTAAGLLQQPLRQLNQVNVRLQQVVAAGKRIYELVTEPLDAVGLAQEKILVAAPKKAPPPRAPRRASTAGAARIPERFLPLSGAHQRRSARMGAARYQSDAPAGATPRARGPQRLGQIHFFPTRPPLHRSHARQRETRRQSREGPRTQRLSRAVRVRLAGCFSF